MQVHVPGCATGPLARVYIFLCKTLALRIDLLVLMTKTLLWDQVNLDLSTLAAFGFSPATGGRF